MKVSSCSSSVGAAEHRDDREARPQHRLDALAAQLEPADLQEGGADRHRGGDVDVGELEGDEKQNDREEVEQELHRERPILPAR